MLDLSIIIINWNTRDLLHQCIASIPAGMSDQVSYEVFVVDNGSKDGSQQMIKDEYPQVILIQNPCNRGFAAANNQAMQRAQGRYCLLLNSDTIMIESCIDKVINYLDANPNVGMAGPRLLNEDGSIQNSVGSIPNVLTETTQRSLMRLLFPKRYYGRRFQPTEPVFVESLVGASLYVRTKLIKELGMLDEDYFFFLEETDWCLRALKADWKIVFLPDAKIYHLQGKSATPVQAEARIEYWRSRYLFFKKHYPRWHGWILKVGLLAKLLVNLVSNSLIGCFNAKAKHKAWVCAQIFKWHLQACPQKAGLPRN